MPTRLITYGAALFTMALLSAAATAAHTSRMRVLATAYCLRGRTASGTYVHPGSVAVDPRVIRMGAHLRIPGYGLGHAEDTGSAVQGHHIDLWMASCAAARRWGARHVAVTVR